MGGAIAIYNIKLREGAPMTNYSNNKNEYPLVIILIKVHD